MSIKSLRLLERSVRIVMRHAKPIFNFNPGLNQFISTPYARFVFHILTLIYLELVFRLWVFNTLLNAGTLYSILFSFPAGTLVFALSSFFSEKANRILSVILTLLYSLFFAIQIVYYSVFRTFLSLYSISGAGQVLPFWRHILTAIWKSLPAIIAIFLPFALLLVFGLKRFTFKPLVRKSLYQSAAILGVTYLLSLTFLTCSSHDIYSPYDLYFKTSAPQLSVQKLGLTTTMRLDIQRLIFGFNPITRSDDESITSSTVQSGCNSESSGNAPLSEVSAPEYKANIIDIDFKSLAAKEKDKTIKSMHKYFDLAKPTMKNQYTGMFKGCNLIFITAESFSHYAIDKEVTPTLYKLANEGFVFNNFYNPVWGVSTSDGEYVACTGLLPKSGVWSFFRSGNNWLPFAMGNQLLKSGYTSRAYHNHTYTYYHRDISHPNMGYVYKGLGNGLDISKSWPESDLEMIDVTTPEYINDNNFSVYYMTVSGHLNYTFSGNYIASKNREFVEHLPYSESVKAYLACNIELDRALKLLLERLNQAGVAEKTVIVISADHYPYGLTMEELSELAGHSIEENFELYKSSLIIYKQGMKPVVVDKVCSSLDIIPTISNLLGLEYDSRLLMGHDILSDSPPLVIFGNRSWITDKARYNSVTNTLENLTQSHLPENYLYSINRFVNDKFQVSTNILDKDYYRIVLPPDNS